MAFKLMEQEKKYLDILKEAEIIKHVGSGPKDPAPEEKEAKSPVEDSTGTGTKQAATGHPNEIPPVPYLKKELAKEEVTRIIEGGVEADIRAILEGKKKVSEQADTPAKDKNDEKDKDEDEDDDDDDDFDEDEDEASEDIGESVSAVRKGLLALFREDLTEAEISELIKTRTLPERIKKQLTDQDYANRVVSVMQKRRTRQLLEPLRQKRREREKMARKGFPDTKPLFTKEDIESIVKDMDEQMDPNQSMMPRYVPGSPAERMAKQRMRQMRVARPISREQMMAARGSTFDKIAARQSAASGAGTPPTRTPVENPAARAAAYAKQKQIWAQQAAAKKSALPPAVQRQRRPVAPAAITKPAVAPPVRPVSLADRMRGKQINRPLPGGGTPRPAMRGGGPI